MIKLTDHAIDRSWQRYRIGDKKLVELCEKAMMNGFSINDAPHRKLKKYLKRSIKGDAIPYCYSGYVFVMKVFTDEALLITTFRLPKQFYKYI